MVEVARCCWYHVDSLGPRQEPGWQAAPAHGLSVRAFDRSHEGEGEGEHEYEHEQEYRMSIESWE